MSNKNVEGKKVAILATDGFEKSELFEPKKALEAAGVEVTVVSLKMGEIKSWDKKNWGQSLAVDKTLDQCQANDFAALILPGGVINPDHLRTQKAAVQFVKDFAESGKPIAAICHGPWMLVEAGLVEDREVTSWPSLKTDISNAGGKWVDREVVCDGCLITSRNPDDLPAFNEKVLEALASGAMHPQKAKNKALTSEGAPH